MTSPATTAIVAITNFLHMMCNPFRPLKMPTWQQIFPLGAEPPPVELFAGHRPVFSKSEGLVCQFANLVARRGKLPGLCNTLMPPVLRRDRRKFATQGAACPGTGPHAAYFS